MLAQGDFLDKSRKAFFQTEMIDHPDTSQGPVLTADQWCPVEEDGVFKSEVPTQPPLGTTASECGVFPRVWPTGMVWRKKLENHRTRRRQKLKTQSSTLNGPVKEQTKQAGNASYNSLSPPTKWTYMTHSNIRAPNL